MAHIVTADQIMSKKLVTLRPDMDMIAAMYLLLKHRVSGATVVDQEDRVLGVLSEKDCLRMFANGAYNELPSAHVSDYMSRTLTTIAPDTDLFTIAGIFLKSAFRRLPVVKDGKLVGQVSRRDVLDGSRAVWLSSPVKKKWTDSKYIPDEIQARLDSDIPEIADGTR